MTMMKLLLEPETPSDLVAAALAYAVLQNLELQIFYLGQMTHSWQRDLERSYSAGGGQNFSLCALGERADFIEKISGQDLLVLLPQQVNLDTDATELDVFFSAPMSELIEALDSAGLQLAEVEIEAICQQRLDKALLSAEAALEQAHAFIQRWLTLDLATALESQQELRRLHQLELWRDGLMDSPRAWVEPIIERVYRDPQDWVAQLALLFYRRELVGHTWEQAPANVQDLAHALIAGNRRLQLLPALDDLHVTVVLPSYNRLDLLKQAVATVLAQTDTHWTLLIGNDASQDGTAAYLDSLQHPQIEVIHNPQNLGFAKTMQKLLARCQTELVLNYADDQFMQPELIAKTRAFFEARPWVAAVGGGLKLSRADGSGVLEHGPYYAQAQVAQTQRELQRHAMICPLGPTWVYRKSCLAEIAEQDSWFCPAGEAYALWDYLISARLTARYEMGYLPEQVMQMHYADDTMSAQRDNVYDLLGLIEGLMIDYTALYGPVFPASLIAYFLRFREHEIKMRFEQKILAADAASTLDSEVAQQHKNWSRWLQVRQSAQANCERDQALLIEMQNPYR